MEEAEKRKLAEKERRLAQERERVERERVLREKVAACAFARGYLGGLMGTVFQDLYRTGFFFDPVEREVAETFLPWLQTEALGLLARQEASRAAARSVVEAALSALHAARERAEGERQAEVQRREEEARRAAEARAQREQRLRALVGDKASFMLGEMEPRPLPEEQVAAARAELEARHAAWAEGEFKLQREAAAMKARLAAEAAEDEAEGEEPEAEGEGAPDGEAKEAGESEELQRAMQEAMDAVTRPEPRPVTDLMVALHVYDGATAEFRAGVVAALRTAFPEETEAAMVGPPPAPPSEYPASEAPPTLGAETEAEEEEGEGASSSEEEDPEEEDEKE